MITVIIAGGSGTRLWPLSTPDYPKHLLSVNGNARTLIQSTYDRAKLLGGQIYVVSEKSHIHHIKEQLPEMDKRAFIVEPARRGTANCIVSLLAHISKQGTDPDEPIIFLSADHFIRDNEGFVHSFNIAADASKQTGRIVLVGAEPDYPATGFGYIKKGKVFDPKTFVFNVDSFKEKPEHKVAQSYTKSGNYLWNCGYFVGSLSTFLKEMASNAPKLHKAYKKLSTASSDDKYEKAYLKLEPESIDYGLIEHVKDLLVVPASFDWMDLGSFNDLHKAVESDELGNHVHGDKVVLEEVENSLVQNYEDKPVAVIGLDNIAVINTPHGIVVTRKDLSQKVGDVSKRFNLD